MNSSPPPTNRTFVSVYSVLDVPLTVTTFYLCLRDLLIQCPRNPTVRRSTFGDTGQPGNGIKTNSGDPSKTTESDRPTIVEHDGRV